MEPKLRRIRNEKILRFGDDILTGTLSNHVTTWRVIPLDSHLSICEFQSQTVDATFRQFSDWVTMPSAILEDHPFYHLPKFSDGLVAVYADYKYFFNLFPCDSTPSLSVQESKLYHQYPYTKSLNQSQSQSLDLILDWRDYDSESGDAREATLWIGSRGAHTPLHYDSYGRNLILQIYGEKMWSLWSPSDENLRKLSPCRVPFEESTIYADPQRYDPRIQSHIEIHPPEVTQHLAPQDVLDVPKHWWHYVSTVSETFVPSFFTPPPSSLVPLSAER
jgi:hypothetical protein